MFNFGLIMNNNTIWQIHTEKPWQQDICFTIFTSVKQESVLTHIFPRKDCTFGASWVRITSGNWQFGCLPHQKHADWTWLNSWSLRLFRWYPDIPILWYKCIYIYVDGVYIYIDGIYIYPRILRLHSSWLPWMVALNAWTYQTWTASSLLPWKLLPGSAEPQQLRLSIATAQVGFSGGWYGETWQCQNKKKQPLHLGDFFNHRLLCFW